MKPNETHLELNQRIVACDRPLAFITGSSSDRVGRRVAEYFAFRGFDIALHSHSGRDSVENWRMEIEQATQCKTSLLVGAVEDETVVEKWREKLLESFGRIDVVVNSAAIWDPRKLEETKAADFERQFQVNALGTALVCKSMGLEMTKSPSGGAIVNLGDWSVCRPYEDFAAYFPSKAAVQAITQSMAVELARRNPRVRVNAVLPGPVMLDHSVSEAHRQRIVMSCLLQREGTAGDIAQAAYYLATSPFVTGVCLPVDGGRTIYAGDASGESADAIAHPSYSS